MNRFRPNIVLDGCSAWAEDGWESFTAGTAEGSSLGPIDFALVKPCDRCKVGASEPHAPLACGPDSAASTACAATA